MSKKYIIICIISSMALLGWQACKSSYVPPAITASASYLVVEGTIATGSADSTVMKLSHTVNISGKDTATAEAGAQVAVQDEAGRSYTLADYGSGRYASTPLNLPLTGKYRLTIKRADGNVYQSDYVQAKSSPTIDSITYKALNEGLYISVNTHDASNDTRYYRWDFQENWEFHPYYFSNYVVDKNLNNVRERALGEYVNDCFQSQKSNSITINSNAKLTQDVISQQPITFVSGNSEKVNYIYSIEVRQYPLTEEAYNFWQNLKKNTEQLGSIFDAQPSQLTGNIHNTANIAEPVIGYISAGTIAKKRIYVKRSDIARRWLTAGNESCKIDSLLLTDKFGTNQVREQLLTYLQIPLETITKIGTPTPIGYTGSSRYCGDCTTRGTTKKPSFWPY